MNVEERLIDGFPVIELRGRFDAYTTPPVTAILDTVAGAAPARGIVNLAGVNFLDSAALAALLRGLKRCRLAGGNLYLCCLQQPVQIIFELTRMDKAFDLFPDVEAAVTAANAGL